MIIMLFEREGTGTRRRGATVLSWLKETERERRGSKVGLLPKTRESVVRLLKSRERVVRDTRVANAPKSIVLIELSNSREQRVNNYY